MKFTFKIQKYQTQAVDAIVKCFEGQQFADKVQYLRDKGIMPQVVKPADSSDTALTLDFCLQDRDSESLDASDDGYRNADLVLGEKELLENIQKVQDDNFIIRNSEIKKTAGVPG